MVSKYMYLCKVCYPSVWVMVLRLVICFPVSFGKSSRAACHVISTWWAQHGLISNLSFIAGDSLKDFITEVGCRVACVSVAITLAVGLVVNDP